MAMEAAAVEAELPMPATGVMEGAAPELGAVVAPEATVGTHVERTLRRAQSSCTLVRGTRSRADPFSPYVRGDVDEPWWPRAVE
jgi:hypothetical protein